MIAPDLTIAGAIAISAVAIALPKQALAIFSMTALGVFATLGLLGVW